MGRGNDTYWSTSGEQCRQGRNNSDSEEIQESTEEDEESEGWTDNRINDFTSVWYQEPRPIIGAAVRRSGSGIRGFAGRFCGERGDVHEGWSAP